MAKMAAHPNLNTPIRVAIAFMALRLLFYFAGWNGDSTDMIFVFVALAGLIPLSIYALWPREDEQNLLEGIFASLRAQLPYAVLICIFIFVYYSFIDTEYFPATRQAIIEGAQAEQPVEKHAEIAENVNQFFSVRNGTAMLLISFLGFSLFYAIFFTAIKRVAFKKQG